MLCEKCKLNEATVFFQQTINGETKEHFLCPVCASLSYSDMSFQNLFQGFLNNFVNKNGIELDKPNAPTKKCSCGYSYNDIKNIGKLGCKNCYTTFKTELDEIIRSFQGAGNHTGKTPKRQFDNIVLEKKLDLLKIKLKQRIQSEEYEEAAKIRDEIRKIEGGKNNG